MNIIKKVFFSIGLLAMGTQGLGAEQGEFDLEIKTKGIYPTVEEAILPISSIKEDERGKRRNNACPCCDYQAQNLNALIIHLHSSKHFNTRLICEREEFSIWYRK